MIYSFKPNNDHQNNHHLIQFDSGLSNEEIDWIRTHGDKLETTNVKLYGKFGPEHVKATGSHFKCDDETSWLYEKMANVVAEINSRYYRYELYGFYENFYYLKYDMPGDHFNWHLDMGRETKAPRKLSLVLQLSDPIEYEGGEFDVLIAINNQRAEKKKGIITAFPSYKIHRVTPVTKGTRRTLTMFACGPNFR